MRCVVSAVLAFMFFTIMMGLWFTVWFVTDWLHHYY